MGPLSPCRRRPRPLDEGFGSFPALQVFPAAEVCAVRAALRLHPARRRTHHRAMVQKSLVWGLLGRSRRAAERRGAPSARVFGASVVVAGLVAGCSGGDEGGEERPVLGDEPGADPATELMPQQPVAEQPVAEPESGTGTDLVPSDGWVLSSSNGVGIQGSFFTYGDGSGRTMIAESPNEASTGYCVAGESAQVLDDDFGGTWGAVAAFNLNQAVGQDEAGPYDARSHAVVGFAFDIVGDTGGALRYVVKQWGVHDGFCINNVPDCEQGCSAEYRIDELEQNCWDPGGRAPTLSQLSALEWQITTTAEGPTPFDFCIENVRAVLGDTRLQ